MEIIIGHNNVIETIIHCDIDYNIGDEVKIIGTNIKFIIKKFQKTAEYPNLHFGLLDINVIGYLFTINLSKIELIKNVQ